MLLALALSLLALDCAAAMRRIDPGKDPKLAPDEGLVVLSVDASVAIISAVRVADTDRTAQVINNLNEGRNVGLYAAKAGEYRWSEVDMTTLRGRLRYTLTSEDYRFKVTAGKIVYPGDLILRPTSWTSMRFHAANRSLPVIDWLETAHPKVYPAVPFEYTGRYPDPFPAFYRKARASNTTPAARLNDGREAPEPIAVPLPAKVMWRPDRIEAVAINGAGDLMAETVLDNNGNWGVDLIDLVTGDVQRLVTSAYSADELMWKDSRTLIAATGDDDKSYTLFRIGAANNGKRSITRLPISGTGRIVDLLPDVTNHILFEGFDSRGDLVVHRVELVGNREISGFQTAKSRDRLNVGVTKDVSWYTDGRGQLRAAVVVRDEVAALVYGRDGVYEEVLRWEGEGGFRPVGLSYDGNTIYGYTDDDRGQRDLVAFDPVSRKVSRTVFSKPGVDLSGVVFNERREPVAARYYQSGRLVTEYFDETNRNLDRTLQAAFPGRMVAVLDRSRDDKQLILWVSASDHPPELYHLDMVRKQAALLEAVAPWLSDMKFSPAYVMNVKSSDGLSIEAFLTLPPGTDKRPLVVFPHGGPIGVSDRLTFDRDVQFLAAQGYAVLQVNYRGSDGYGKAFREAGHRNYGRLIEDDIDAAVRSALAAYPLDESRMCTLGASYGGYSALVSAVRWPGRFRCAVSLSGLSDRTLFFTASDAARSAQVRPLMERVMGDPRTDMAEMQATSPLYHVDSLKLPVMLVHGREDVRVDFEHTRRLVRMLNLQGQPPVLLALPDMGHGFSDAAEADLGWTSIAGFLQQHLGTTPAITEAEAKAKAATPVVAAPAAAACGQGGGKK
ncbi:S9 family peptidase [Lysobacter sp. S4-A87]|uniref:alpha/beta hydrolase family protein n=1 Tax=Lysobacter sp. S4-A87 TaxID=2925843 RepID=UPI001F531C96|nr:S9 family peptidase [Lysobacter sp. S4-A87]UNK49524.1 S9 family peptidase [Lysobacter sp. S4-A87]